MNLLTFLVLTIVISIGLIISLIFIYYSKRKKVKKRVVYANCRIKVQEIKRKLEEFREKQAKVKRRRRLWRTIARIGFKLARITVTTFIIPLPDIFPDIDLPFADIGDFPQDFDIADLLPDDYDFEGMIVGFETGINPTDQDLDSIPLEALETYERQLDEILQELDEALAHLED